MDGQENTDRKADDSPRQPALPAPLPTENAKVLGGTEGQPPAKPETETEKLLRGTRTIEWLQFSANAALAIIGVFAVCIYGGQLKVMRGQLTEIQKQYPELQKSAQAAKDAAAAARDSITQAQEASHLDQRPWVLPRMFKLSAEPEVDKQFTVEIFETNTGRTPGLDVAPQSQVGLLYNCNMLPAMKEISDIKSRGMMPTGQVDASFTSEPSPNITEPMLRSYNNGVTKVFVQGLLRYTDAFHQAHWTRFRVFHEHGTALNVWSYCETGNDVDRTPNAQQGEKHPN